MKMSDYDLKNDLDLFTQEVDISYKWYRETVGTPDYPRATRGYQIAVDNYEDFVKEYRDRLWDLELLPKVYCQGCEEFVVKLEDEFNVDLCSACNDKFDDQTGYCSLDCCLGGGCDDSC